MLNGIDVEKELHIMSGSGQSDWVVNLSSSAATDHAFAITWFNNCIFRLNPGSVLRYNVYFKHDGTIDLRLNNLRTI
jgi:hypothetical protein